MTLSWNPPADLIDRPGNVSDGAKSAFIVRVGRDLQLAAFPVVDDPTPWGPGPGDERWHLQLFNMDGDYLSTLGIADNVAGAYALLPSAVGAATLLYPNHLISDGVTPAA